MKREGRVPGWPLGRGAFLGDSSELGLSNLLGVDQNNRH